MLATAVPSTRLPRQTVRWQFLGPTGCCVGGSGGVIGSIGVSGSATTVNSCKAACAANTECGAINVHAVQRSNGGWFPATQCDLLTWLPEATGSDSNVDCRCYKKRDRPANPQTSSPTQSPTTASSISVPPTSSPTPSPTVSPTTEAPTAPTSSPTQPHILFVVADDLGSNDLGYKNQVVQTPTIDGLAAQGIKMTAYYTYVNCAPTRTAFLTGRYAWRQGFFRGYNGGPQFRATNEGFDMLPRILKDEGGYFTVMAGKWHLGYVLKEHTPTYRGFDKFLGLCRFVIKFVPHNHR